MLRVLFAAALLALSSCSQSRNGGDGGDGGEGVAAVQPSQVTSEALRAAVSDRRLTRFYEARGWSPAWNEGSARTLVAAIGQAPRHGLHPARFLAAAGRAGNPVEKEAALSLAALDYGEALARGAIDPARIRDDYSVPRPAADLVAGLGDAVESGGLQAWFAALAPQDAEYRALSEAFLAANRASRTAVPPIPAGPAIRPAAADARLPAIAAALERLGYDRPAPAPNGQQAKGSGSPSRYTPDLVSAVRALQEDHGLAANGIVGEATLAALNQGGARLAHALAVNLERRRWLPRRAPPTRVDVNIVAATLAYWRDGAVVDRRPVITGQPGNETPELVSPMFQLVANPSWTVPQSIEEEEILPKGAAYLARNNMTRREGRIVQEPGPGNSLGLVKFDMRNDQAIYLHDTPAKALFAERERHFSHGCVRVHDALGLARMIAGHEGVLERWERAQRDEGDAEYDEAFVQLPREIPVRLLYHTAFLDGGRIRYRPDVYGWDAQVAIALGFPVSRVGTRRPHRPDLGP